MDVIEGYKCTQVRAPPPPQSCVVTRSSEAQVTYIYFLCTHARAHTRTDPSMTLHRSMRLDERQKIEAHSRSIWGIFWSVISRDRSTAVGVRALGTAADVRRKRCSHDVIVMSSSVSRQTMTREGRKNGRTMTGRTTTSRRTRRRGALTPS